MTKPALTKIKDFVLSALIIGLWSAIGFILFCYIIGVDLL